MKKVLVTGKNSYVGTSLEKWIRNHSEKYSIHLISLRKESWKQLDFSEYDVVCHVAGIAHIKEKKENAYLYYKINRDLAFETAKKAKNEGVKHFIFLSSMSVYGIESGIINKDSPLNPKNSYGKSKLQAEKLIFSIEDETFKVSVIRPPMIYGRGCNGNYPRLANLGVRVPFFPYIKNERSMIYIDNLSEFIRMLIDRCTTGIFTPQNEEYVCTSEMVKLINEANGKKIFLIRFFNPLLKTLFTSKFKKVFGDLTYEKTMSIYEENYNNFDFKSSIHLTERSK